MMMSTKELVAKNGFAHGKKGTTNGYHSARAQQRIRVCVRARPLTIEEVAEGDRVWELVDHGTIREAFVENRKRRIFHFDRIFDEDTRNEEVYEEFGRDVAQDVMRGYHGALMAYGQTSTGKTHTMQGTPDEPGLIPLAIEACFAYIEDEETSEKREYVMKVSYIEVYNETLRDLLGDGGEPRLVEDHREGSRLTNVAEAKVASIGDVFEAIVRGEAKRAVGETIMNSRSSRSHAVLRLDVESRDRDGTTNVGTLSFVDLAGSERARPGSDTDRLKEGCFINKSLHALAHVVAKLSSGQPQHVPYRDSKLTRLLRPALGGNARAAVVCTISMARSAADETANTLHFATRAKKVVQSAKRNALVDASSQLAAYRQQVDDLKQQLRHAQEAAAPAARLAKEERLALVAAVQHLERLILRSGRAAVSPTRPSTSDEDPAAAEELATVQQHVSRFFSSTASCRRRRDRNGETRYPRSLTLPPTALPPDMLPPPAERQHSVDDSDASSRTPPRPADAPTPKQRDLGSQLLRIKAAIEQVLAKETEATDLLEALDRSRDDTSFVLQQLDASQAENARLKAQVDHLTRVVQAREAEILKLKGLASQDDETF